MARYLRRANIIYRRECPLPIPAPANADDAPIGQQQRIAAVRYIAHPQRRLDALAAGQPYSLIFVLSGVALLPLRLSHIHSERLRNPRRHRSERAIRNV